MSNETAPTESSVAAPRICTNAGVRETKVAIGAVPIRKRVASSLLDATSVNLPATATLPDRTGHRVSAMR